MDPSAKGNEDRERERDRVSQRLWDPLGSKALTNAITSPGDRERSSPRP
jgi:hypothetical protein